MRIRNIRRLMAFRETGGQILSLTEIADNYPIAPVGTHTYYGINEANVQRFRDTGSALGPSHRNVMESVLAALRESDVDEMTFQLVVEPLQIPQPYEFVAANMPLLRQLAAELLEYQAEASTFGKRLNLLFRYASEMNDRGAIHGGVPAKFKQSFVQVRQLLAECAPRILFPFSPALRADLDIQDIRYYWPGNDFVDVIGATWYVHGESQRLRGMANMRNYFLRWRAENRPFALDEFGGAEGSGNRYCDNDAMLRDMLEEIESLNIRGISFAYGTIFLDDRKYGIDATLKFLSGRALP